MAKAILWVTCLILVVSSFVERSRTQCLTEYERCDDYAGCCKARGCCKNKYERRYDECEKKCIVHKELVMVNGNYQWQVKEEKCVFENENACMQKIRTRPGVFFGRKEA